MNALATMSFFKTIQVILLWVIMWSALYYGSHLSKYSCENLNNSNMSENEVEDGFHRYEENGQDFCPAMKTADKRNLLSTFDYQNHNHQELEIILKIQAFWAFLMFVICLFKDDIIEDIIWKTNKCYFDVVKMWLFNVRRNQIYNRLRYLKARDEGVQTHVENVKDYKRYAIIEIVIFVTVVLNFSLCIYIKNNASKLFTQNELIWKYHQNMNSFNGSEIDCFKNQKDHSQFAYLIMCCIYGFTAAVSSIAVFPIVKQMFLSFVDTYINRKIRHINLVHLRLMDIYSPDIEGIVLLPTFFECLLIKYFEDAGASQYIGYIVGNIYMNEYGVNPETILTY